MSIRFALWTMRALLVFYITSRMTEAAEALRRIYSPDVRK